MAIKSYKTLAFWRVDYFVRTKLLLYHETIQCSLLTRETVNINFHVSVSAFVNGISEVARHISKSHSQILDDFTILGKLHDIP